MQNLTGGWFSSIAMSMDIVGSEWQTLMKCIQILC